MLTAGEGGGVAPKALSFADRQQMKVETETLKQFRGKVEVLLKELESSPASSQRVGNQRLVAGHLGSGFAEAEDLHTAYQTVHTKLEELFHSLSEQIDAMTITIQVAESGYQNVEADQIAALWKIRDQTDQAYQAANRTGGQAPSTAQPAPGIEHKSYPGTSGGRF